jgi:hypothetical protein
MARNAFDQDVPASQMPLIVGIVACTILLLVAATSGNRTALLAAGGGTWFVLVVGLPSKSWVVRIGGGLVLALVMMMLAVALH